MGIEFLKYIWVVKVVSSTLVLTWITSVWI